MRRIFIGLGVLLGLPAAFIVVLFVRSLLADSGQLSPQGYEPLPIDKAAAAERLSRAITFKTISHQIPWEFRGSEFEAFHTFLEETYPQVHETLERETVTRYSLLYTWQGSKPELPAIVFLAHQDVVPVDAGSAEEWTHPPFEGVITDTHVWGRGALDNKASVLGLLEASEALIVQGFQPERSIYFAFGHDEELGGEDGASEMARLLKERGVEAWFTLDEGSGITDGVLPGLSGPVALISVSEKGYLTLELKVRGEGGHSSNPPPSTSIGILAKAITRIEGSPFDARLDGPLIDMFEGVGPEMDYPFRLIMTNLWLFKPLLRWQLGKDPVTNAALRTTTAVTMMEAGTKENVLPIEAKATINFRLLAGDSTALVTERIREIVDDERVEITVGKDNEPSPVSDKNSEAFSRIAQSVRNVLPHVPVAPGMTLAGTDTKHYHELAENLYRLQPLIFTPADMATIHGTDERVAIENYYNSLQIFGQFLQVAGVE